MQFRAILEALGAEAEWIPNTQIVVARGYNIVRPGAEVRVELKVGEKYATVNVSKVPLDVAAATVGDSRLSLRVEWANRDAVVAALLVTAPCWAERSAEG